VSNALVLEFRYVSSQYSPRLIAQSKKCNLNYNGRRGCSRCVRLQLPCTERIEEWEDGDSMEELQKQLLACDSQETSGFPGDLGERLFLWAAEFGHLRIVELLLEIGVNVNVENGYRETALHLSAQRSRPLVVRALLNAGASVTAEGESASTALHYAAEVGDKTVISNLIHAGAKLNARDNSGWTPLHRAVDRDQLGAIRQLLGAGSDPNSKDSEGKTPIVLRKSKEADDILYKAGGWLNGKDKGMRHPNEAVWELVAERRAMLDADGDPQAAPKTTLAFFSMLDAWDQDPEPL
jgi:hypothetical protein